MNKTISIMLLLLGVFFVSWVVSPPEADPGFESQIIFPLQQEHVHGPTVVELSNEDLLAAWFQGSGERWADDVRIMGSRLQKGDSIWSEPFLMADIPGFPDINPMLFVDPNEQLWLMWYPVIANQWESSIPMYRTSTDYLSPGAPKWNWQDIIFVKAGGKTERGIVPGDPFVEAVHQQLQDYESYLKTTLLPELPEEVQKRYEGLWQAYSNRVDSLARGMNLLRKGRIPDENGGYKDAMLGYPLSRRIGWQTKNKPYMLDNHRMIVPLYSDLFDASLFAVTDDWGKTWEFSNPVLGGAGIQPTIAQKKDGTLVAYLRDNGPPPKRMQRTESRDRGLSWTIAKDDQLPNSGAGFDMTTLSNGDWLIAFNDTEEGRHNLAVAISSDEGKTWPIKKYIENDLRGKEATASHYPAVIQGRDGRVHVIYSYHHNDRKGGPHKTIKHAAFTLDWIESKK